MDQGAFGYGIPTPQQIEAMARKKAEEERQMAIIQRFAQDNGGPNPVQEYMNQGAFGKMGDAAKEMLMGGASTVGAGALAGVGGPLGVLGSGAFGLKALGHVGQSLSDYGDAMQYRRGRSMWDNTGLPGRPTGE